MSARSLVNTAAVDIEKSSIIESCNVNSMGDMSNFGFLYLGEELISLQILLDIYEVYEREFKL